MLNASEQMDATLIRFQEEYGETVTLWRNSKGLATSLQDGVQSPVPRAPLRVEVLFADRMGDKMGGTATVYVAAVDVSEHSLTTPGEEWRIQRSGEQEQKPVMGGFKPLGSGENTAWWTGQVGSGGKTSKADAG